MVARIATNTPSPKAPDPNLLLQKMAPSHFYDEQEVLLRVAEGDEKAFRALFNQHHQRLGAHIERLTKSHELAEEIVQDVFLKLWMTRETLAQIQDFRAYLFVLSKNHTLNCLKKLARQQVALTDLEHAHNEAYSAETADERDYYGLIDEAIDHLPPQQKKVYLLSRHERLRYADIAAELNLSTETVKKYLQLASESISAYVRKRLITMILVIFLLSA